MALNPEPLHMMDIIGREIRERRSIEQACADLQAKHDKHRTPELARMINQLQAEIAARNQPG